MVIEVKDNNAVAVAVQIGINVYTHGSIVMSQISKKVSQN
jgi:hypothetical protein